MLLDAAVIRRAFDRLRADAPEAEIIIVDGGSTDGSFEIANKIADRAVQSPRGRAIQMNAGATSASGDVFRFVHADSAIAQSSLASIEKTLIDPKVVGGCFRLRIDSLRWIYRIRDALGNLLVDLTGVALGDRGFFCRRETFIAVGGYPEISILEDAEFYRGLKRHGRVIQLKESIGTSPRRYEKLGPAMTMLFYALVMLLYVARVPIGVLERMVCAYMKRRTRS